MGIIKCGNCNMDIVGKGITLCGECFCEDRTKLAMELFSEVLEYLKHRYEIGDKINHKHIFIKFKCGDYASLLLMEMLEDFGYVSHHELIRFTRKVIRLPE